MIGSDNGTRKGIKRYQTKTIKARLNFFSKRQCHEVFFPRFLATRKDFSSKTSISQKNLYRKFELFTWCKNHIRAGLSGVNDAVELDSVVSMSFLLTPLSKDV